MKGATVRSGLSVAATQQQATYAEKVKQNLGKLKSLNNRRSSSRSISSSSPRKPLAYRGSYSRGSSRDRVRRSSFDRRRTYGRSRSRGKDNSHSSSKKK